MNSTVRPLALIAWSLSVVMLATGCSETRSMSVTPAVAIERISAKCTNDQKDHPLSYWVMPSAFLWTLESVSKDQSQLEFRRVAGANPHAMYHVYVWFREDHGQQTFTCKEFACSSKLGDFFSINHALSISSPGSFVADDITTVITTPLPAPTK